ncbi:MAG: succinate dehydrogenase iron-sulfur subunit [Spirochaetaceae bacterium]|nr:MAG: succinate dehydrogenase iron-sulfur subunit [Spirochaetaceae bacterium]
MNVTLEIQRFNAEQDASPTFRKYAVTVEPTDRVLDALIDISRNIDGTLAFRKSCAHGVCGSDAMRINGKERLACKTLIQDVASADGDTIVIEPLRHLPNQRDLMVDQSVFFEKFRSVKPFFIPAGEPNGAEYFQSQDDRELFDEATKCINCAACYSACPILDKNPAFIGPAAIVQAARFINDSRDTGLEARIDILDSASGVWPCENHFECTRVCPREIKITKLINLTKRQIKKYREERGEETAESQVPKSENKR